MPLTHLPHRARLHAGIVHGDLRTSCLLTDMGRLIRRSPSRGERRGHRDGREGGAPGRPRAAPVTSPGPRRARTSPCRCRESRTESAGTTRRTPGAPGAYTPPRATRDDDPLAARQAFGTLVGVAERLARHRDAVDPGLELRGNAEVVKGCADDDYIGARNSSSTAALRAASARSAPASDGPRQVWQLLGRQVAVANGGACGWPAVIARRSRASAAGSPRPRPGCSNRCAEFSCSAP